MRRDEIFYYAQKTGRIRFETQLRTDLLTESDFMILEMCLNEPAASKNIQLKLGIKRSGSFKNSLTKLLKMGLLSQTIPDKPSSPKQKYAATKLAKAIIEVYNTES